MYRLGRGSRTEMGISSSATSISSNSDREGDPRWTGSRVSALVEGAMSWVGSGCRLMEADWIVDAISATPWGTDISIKDLSERR